jgi:hypothetical protein
VRSVRFDVIACVRAPAEPAEPDGWLLEHWQGAFDAP